MVTEHNRTEKMLARLEEEGYDEGPPPSAEFNLRNGDHVGLSFRGNITCADEPEAVGLDVIFTSQIPRRMTFDLMEVNRFLQRNYSHYRCVLPAFIFILFDWYYETRVCFQGLRSAQQEVASRLPDATSSIEAQ